MNSEGIGAARQGDPMDEFGRTALEYAVRWQIPVFPLQQRGKTPVTVNGLKDASTEPKRIAQFWERSPRANIGGVMGAIAGIFALDVDPRHGGDDSLRNLESEYGPLPPTWRALTGGGGLHHFFRHPGGQVRNRAGIRPGLDVRGDGGYVVLAPSIHESGRRYVWEVDHSPSDLRIAEAPAWLLSMMEERKLSKGTPAQEWQRIVQDGADEGCRNMTASRLAGHLLRRLDPMVARDLIHCWNEVRNRPPMPFEEVERIIESIACAELRRRRERPIGGGNRHE